MPEECDLVAAGALPVVYGTSHVALVHRAQLKSGQVGIRINALVPFLCEVDVKTFV